MPARGKSAPSCRAFCDYTTFLLEQAVGLFIRPGISFRSWAHKPTPVGKPESTAETV